MSIMIRFPAFEMLNTGLGLLDDNTSIQKSFGLFTKNAHHSGAQREVHKKSQILLNEKQFENNDAPDIVSGFPDSAKENASIVKSDTGKDNQKKSSLNAGNQIIKVDDGFKNTQKKNACNNKVPLFLQDVHASDGSLKKSLKPGKEDLDFIGSSGSNPESSGNLLQMAQNDALQNSQVFMQMIMERQKHFWNIFKKMQDSKTDIMAMISEALALRSKVMDVIAFNWSDVLKGPAEEKKI